MARFYGSMKGSAKGEVTRQGTQESGLEGHLRGWNVGVFVELRSTKEGEDEIVVWSTNGSNGPGRKKVLARFNGKEWDV